MTNILLITVDCLRYDRCGFNGHHRNTTPTLDSLASESLIFDYAYSTGPYTTESFPGILAGQHSHNGWSFGNRPAWKALGQDETLATYLKREGYETGAAISNPHLSKDRNFDRGFDQFTNLRKDTHTTRNNDESRFNLEDYLYTIRERMRSGNSRILNTAYAAYRYTQYQNGWPTKRAETVLDHLVSTIDEFEDEFFAWAHLMDLHAPIHPDSITQGGLSSLGTASILRTDAARSGYQYTPHYADSYDSALRYVDTQIQTLVTELKSRGLWEETILLFTADHGEALYDRDNVCDHPRQYHYDELLHVPLLVRRPTGDGERIETHISLAWLHEIIAHLLDTETGDFPAQSSRNNVLTDTSGIVVSDTLDDRGHTVSVRNFDEKVITHQPTESGDPISWEFRDEDLSVFYRQDPNERSPRTPGPNNQLLAEANELFTSPDQLPSLGEGFSSEMEERLQDLGYKM
ncbi:sulfatase [Natronoglomus mannanivorans]|uniref:Sulfatase n=1 Tax=Natronoglomus mannanivorans TaxID=2979990 RepID=A0AAP2Z2B2_9EURY|nr:sulfatase [Halobacteria archaeon AArc-xg1-1]